MPYVVWIGESLAYVALLTVLIRVRGWKTCTFLFYVQIIRSLLMLMHNVEHFSDSIPERDVAWLSYHYIDGFLDFLIGARLVYYCRTSATTLGLMFIAAGMIALWEKSLADDGVRLLANLLKDSEGVFALILDWVLVYAVAVGIPTKEK